MPPARPASRRRPAPPGLTQCMHPAPPPPRAADPPRRPAPYCPSARVDVSECPADALECPADVDDGDLDDGSRDKSIGLHGVIHWLLPAGRPSCLRGHGCPFIGDLVACWLPLGVPVNLCSGVGWRRSDNPLYGRAAPWRLPLPARPPRVPLRLPASVAAFSRVCVCVSVPCRSVAYIPGEAAAAYRRSLAEVPAVTPPPKHSKQPSPR